MESEEKLLKGLQDSRVDVRLQTADQLMNYFKEHDPRELQELERFIAGLSLWANSGNYKVVLSAMNVLELLSQKMKEKFRQHIVAVLPSLRERLGDAKEPVRDRAQLLLHHFMQPGIAGPQFVLDRLMPHVLGHKNWRVREQGLLCLSKTLESVGAGNVSVGKFVGAICKLLGDANSQVRACAIETLVDIYRHVGTKVRNDLQRRGLPESRLAAIMERFDEVDSSGRQVTTTSDDVTGSHDTTIGSQDTTIGSHDTTIGSHDTTSGSHDTASRSHDTASRSHDTASRSHDPPRSTRPSMSVNKQLPAGRPPSRTSKIDSHRVVGSGAVTKEDFEKLFMDSPTISDAHAEMTKLEAGLGDPKTDWSTHLILLRQLRGVVMACTEPMDGFLRNLEKPLCTLVKDLRSQVLRETCATISYLSKCLTRKFDHVAETVLPVLINVLQSSAKVMSSSCDICIRYVLEYTHNPRLIPVIANGMSSKATSTRSYCSEYCDIIMHTWEPVLLEKQLSILHDTIKTGVSDANPTARHFMRRAYWGLYECFPSTAKKLEQSLDTSQQHYLQEERKNMEKPPNESRQMVPVRYSTSSSKMRKKATLTASEPDILAAVENEETNKPDVKATSASRMERVPSSGTPAVSSGSLTRMAKMSHSVEALDRSPSPGGGRSLLTAPFKTPSKIPSPKAAPKSKVSPKDYTRYGSLPRPKKSRQSGLTKEAMLNVYGAPTRGDRDDNSETGSMTSERSGYSLASEFSILSPYVKYPTPVTDLGELVALCSSGQWAERRDGIAQLQLLLESSRDLSTADINKIKSICNRLFSEPHTKVYSSFLDVLSIFVELKTQSLDDWLFVLLLRLIHKQGGDNLSSVAQKLTMVLDMVRTTFAPDGQFHAMCRILTDPSQPMNNKVKLSWLEYFLLLVPLMESSEFSNSSDVRPALSTLLKMTSEPKSLEIRKTSKKAIISLFELNAASMSLMLRQQPQPLQDAADKILKSYMQTISGSSDEGESPNSSRAGSPSKVGSSPALSRPSSATKKPQPVKAPPLSTTKSATPTHARSRSKTPTTPIRKSPSLSNLSTLNRPTTPQRNTRQRISSTPNPTPTRTLRGNSQQATPTRNSLAAPTLSKKFSSSNPDMRSVGRTEQKGTPQGIGLRPPSSKMMRSQSGQAIAIRRGSSRSSLGNHPVTIPKARVPRSQSVEPSGRPRPQDNLYSPSDYQNGNGNGNPSLFSFLPDLNFGSPEPEETYDHVATVLKQLNSSQNGEEQAAILQTLHGIARERSEMCNWEQNFSPVLLKLVELLQCDNPQLKVLALRVLREMLKSKPELLKDYTEMTIMKVLNAYCNEVAEVSRTAEDIFPPLAALVEPHPTLELLGPMLQSEPHPMLLGVIKLLMKVICNCSKDLLQQKVKEISQGLVKAFSHSESAVRKASVFCMVSLHTIMGEELKPHLSKLSTSQMKLLDLYIKKQAANGHL